MSTVPPVYIPVLSSSSLVCALFMIHAVILIKIHKWLSRTHKERRRAQLLEELLEKKKNREASHSRESWITEKNVKLL